MPTLQERGITSVRDWCRKAGVAESYVNRRMHAKGTRPDMLAFEKLAMVAGVDARWLAYGEGALTRAPDLTLEREPEHIPADDEVPLETAALRVMDRDRHTLRDLDAVRATIHAAPRKETLGADLGETALRLLEAARGLRLEGEAATPTAILWRAAVGRHQRDTDLVDELDEAEDAEVAASLRAKGLVPGQGRAALEADRDAMVAREKKGRRGA